MGAAPSAPWHGEEGGAAFDHPEPPSRREAAAAAAAAKQQPHGAAAEAAAAAALAPARASHVHAAVMAWDCGHPGDQGGPLLLAPASATAAAAGMGGAPDDGRASSSSAGSSLRGGAGRRGAADSSTNDETMPLGRGRMSTCSLEGLEPEGPPSQAGASDEAGGSGAAAAAPCTFTISLPAMPHMPFIAVPLGKLLIRAGGGGGGTEVVWRLPQARLLHGGRATQPGGSGAGRPPGPALALKLTSPLFALPFTSFVSSSDSGGEAGVARPAPADWSLELLPASDPPPAASGQGSRLGDSCSWRLAVRLCSAAAAAPAEGQQQAPGGPAAGPLQPAGVAGELLCRGAAVVSCGGDAAAAQAAFEVALVPGGDSQDLPIALRVGRAAHAAGAQERGGGVAAPPAAARRWGLPQTAPGPAAHEAAAGDAELSVSVTFEALQSAAAAPDPAPDAAAAPAAAPAARDGSGGRPSAQQQLAAGPALPAGAAAPAGPAARPCLQSPALGPGAAASAQLGQAAAGGCRQLQAVLLSTSPRLLVVDGFLDAATCEGLMALAEDKLVRSRVASGSETPSRTSWSHFFVKDAVRHPLVQAVEAQVEALFRRPDVRGPYPPLAKVEALQVVRYQEGEFYEQHYDNRADSSLTRAATVIVYLVDTPAGGATSFPRAAVPEHSARPALRGVASAPPGGRGVNVYPVAGRAVVFWSKRPDGLEDTNSIHAAEAVRDGEKWIATRWMKDD